MNASYEWLKAFVPAEVTVEAVRDLLTERCATVEEVVSLRSDLAGIVVGRVVTAIRHPNSDHLWLTTVDSGQGEPVSVVCGAPNVEQGAFYPFAPVGVTLPGGLKMERRKIRGETSNGMLCSAKELALGADQDGILQLDDDLVPGTPFLDAMPVGGARLVVDVLPNRPDLLSHEGLARELAAALGVNLVRPELPVKSFAFGTAAPTGSKGTTAGVNVHLEDSAGCTRYAGAVVRGVRVGPSPDWLSSRIEAAGGRSINNVVDVTNYMLLGFGQPMHAFDLARLSGSSIVVRKAKQGERITTLDGRDRELTSDMTVIADAEVAQAIAGVIGGSGSEVTTATTDIFVEVAAFDPKRVRATRRSLGVSTDASYRFERGVDVEQIPALLEYAVNAILAVAGGSADSAPVDLYPNPISRQPLSLRVARVARVLGVTVPAEEIRQLLKSVGFESSGESGEALEVLAPSWRGDVVGEADLIEEVARLRGYDSFPSEMRAFRPGTVPDDPLVGISSRMRDLLVGRGMLEVRPLPFVSERPDAQVRVRNPLSEDEAWLRGSVLSTLAGRAEYNLARMQRNIRIFEIGTVFSGGAGISESVHVGALLMGQRRPPHFTEANPPVFDEWDAKDLGAAIAAAAYPGSDVALVAVDGGTLWEINVRSRTVGTIRRLSLDAPVWASPAFGIEVDLTAAASVDAAKPLYVAIPSMPAVEVDLALLGGESISAEQIEVAIRASAGELLESLVLFDEFRGKGIPEGQRSTAWRLTFRHPERTLRDREIQGRTEKILRTLEGELNVRQRTS